MEDGSPGPTPPDPPGNGAPPPPRNASKTRSSTSRPTPPLPPLTNNVTSHTPGRPTVSGLLAFEKNRSRKRQASSGLNDRPTPTANPLGNTPRSQRFKNIFEEANPSLLDVTHKLYEIIEESILLPKKGGEKISSLGSETAADIKILAATALDLVENSTNIPSLRRTLFSNDVEDHRATRDLAGTNAFGCKIPEAVEARLDNIDKSLTELAKALKAPSSTFNFRPPTSKQATAPSYALAASRHAPRPAPAPPAQTSGFKPTSVRKPPTTPPPAIRSTNTITLVQSNKEGKVFASKNYPTLINLVNSKIGEALIKEQPTDDKTIRI